MSFAVALALLACARNPPPAPPPLVESGGLRVARESTPVELPYPGLPGEVLARFNLVNAALAVREREGSLIAVVHADPAVASTLADAGAPDAEVLRQGAWALVRSPDGALHERGLPAGRVMELRLSP